MVTLNHQNSPITRAERLKLNENWVTIVEQFVKIQRQFNIVTGGKEVDELLQRIESAITSAEASVADINELITDVRALIVTTNETIESANTAASNANTKATEAQQATQAANTATASALQAITDIEQIMGEYETRVNDVIANSESATAAANTATQETITAKGQAEQATQAANIATASANESATRANSSAQNADTAASNANQVAQNMSGYDKPIEDFSLTKTFLKHQAARFNGSTYRAKVETTGNPLPTNPAVENDWWTLEAKRGTDGTGAVASVNDQMPDDSGNVQIDVGGGTWDEIENKPTTFPPSAHQHAIDDVDGLRDALNNAGAATLERKIQHFTATEGQTVFTVDHPYTVGSNFMELVVGGIPQFSPENFTESSSTTVTLSEGVPSGTVVTAIYYTGFGGVSAIPNASLTTKGLTKLETATDSDSETTSATPKSVKTVMTKVTENDVKVTILENNINTVEQTLTTHMDNDTRHLMQGERTKWENKRNTYADQYVSGGDPNTTTLPNAVFNHVNMGDNAEGYWYVETTRYNNVNGENRMQVAVSYAANQPPTIKARHYFGGTWSTWSNELNWINGTLSNGWQGTLKYYKNDSNLLIYHFSIVCPNTPNSTICSAVPSGYHLNQLARLYDTSTGDFGVEIFGGSTIFATSPVEANKRYAGVVVGYAI